MKPTDEQIKWFWEQCGLRRFCSLEDDMYHRGIWETPEGMRIDTPDLSSIDALGYLFKYAVPAVFAKLDEKTRHINLGYRATDKEWIGIVQDWRGESYSWAHHKDPALALFWAIYKALGGKE